MNFMIGGSGHVFRAIQLKKEKLTILNLLLPIMLFIHLSCL